MKIFKFSQAIKLLMVFIITIVSTVSFVACTKKTIPQTKYIHQSYTVDAKKPVWLSKNSDLVIEGEYINSDASQIGYQASDQYSQVVYTDSHIKITQVLKNKSNKNIKVGDTVTVRLLGGTKDNLTVVSETENLLPTQGKIILFLADGGKDLSLPKTVNIQYYAIVGEINGVFSLTSDGTAKRDKVKDKFKLNDLLKTIQAQ